MSYYRLLGLAEEPFSTSPDPAFFYEAPGHRSALLRLGTSIWLKRGLSLLAGDVGTGKTTLGRRLYQLFSPWPSVMTQVLLQPAYASELEFLQALLERFDGAPAAAEGGRTRRSGAPEPWRLSSSSRCFQLLEETLFRRAVTERRTVVLIIDEAQKLSDASLEILRILLNYETNEYKLLQVVLLGQQEILPRLQQMPSLWDRVSLKQILSPLDGVETKALIRFRLKAAGYRGRHPLFTEDALEEIFQRTLGYPRRISMLAHEIGRAHV